MALKLPAAPLSLHDIGDEGEGFFSPDDIRKNSAAPMARSCPPPVTSMAMPAMMNHQGRRGACCPGTMAGSFALSATKASTISRIPDAGPGAAFSSPRRGEAWPEGSDEGEPVYRGSRPSSLPGLHPRRGEARQILRPRYSPDLQVQLIRHQPAYRSIGAVSPAMAIDHSASSGATMAPAEPGQRGQTTKDGRISSPDDIRHELRAEHAAWRSSPMPVTAPLPLMNVARTMSIVASKSGTMAEPLRATKSGTISRIPD
jgi:hypothetical protein